MLLGMLKLRKMAKRLSTLKKEKDALEHQLNLMSIGANIRIKDSLDALDKIITLLDGEISDYRVKALSLKKDLEEVNKLIESKNKK